MYVMYADTKLIYHVPPTVALAPKLKANAATAKAKTSSHMAEVCVEAGTRNRYNGGALSPFHPRVAGGLLLVNGWSLVWEIDRSLETRGVSEGGGFEGHHPSIYVHSGHLL